MKTLPKISKELKSAVNDYLLALAVAKTIKPTIDKINQDWLNANQCKAAAWSMMDNFVITRNFDTYLMEEADFARYYKETSASKRSAGFVFEDDTCPLLIAEHNVIKTEWRILEHSECLTGTKDIHFVSMDKRRKYLDLVIKLVVNAPKKMFA